jgi:hypothetical protein
VPDIALDQVPKDAWSEWFEENLCRGDALLKWPRIGMVEWCALYRGDGGSWPFANKAELLAAVMPFRGSVTFKLSVRWNGGTSKTTKTADVSTGWAYAWDFHDDSINDEHDYEFSILNADGDGYHRAVVLTWNHCKRPNAECAPASIDQCVCGVRP